MWPALTECDRKETCEAEIRLELANWTVTDRQTLTEFQTRRVSFAALWCCENQLQSAFLRNDRLG
jgi:hypothetical protein